MSTGHTLQSAHAAVGANEAVHATYAAVRRPAALSRRVGFDVRGFRHGVSNQAIRHVLNEHGNPEAERARGQIAVERSDFDRLPLIVARGRYVEAKQRSFGPPRVGITAEIDGVHYTLILEVRRKQRRLDLVSMWKR